MYQPVNSLNELSKFSNVPLALTGDALASIDRGQQADQSNLQDLFSSNQHQQAMRPMQEQALDLSNQTSRASLPGIIAQSDITGRKNDMERATFGLDVKNKLSEAALKATDNDLKRVAQHAQQLMYSLNPQEALQGKKLWEASQHMMEAKQKHLWDMEKTRLHNEGLVDSRKAGVKGTAGFDLQQVLAKAKTYKQKDALLRSHIATLETDDPAYAQVYAQIQALQPAIINEERAALARARGGYAPPENSSIKPETIPAVPLPPAPGGAAPVQPAKKPLGSY